MPRILLDDPRYYLNRHVQWLDFNRRVLEEAGDPLNPLLERVKFLAITANNLDEFFEVRTAGILQAVTDGVDQPGPDGLGSRDTLARCLAKSREFVAEQYRVWNEELKPALAQAG